MKKTNNQDTRYKQYSNSNNQFPNRSGKRRLVIEFWLLVIIWLLFLGYWSLGMAMGGRPPAKEEPKYKLEILKMEVITAPSPSPEALASKKVLMIIAPKDFQDEEFRIPKETLEAKGVKVTVASSTDKTATGMYGMKVTPDLTIKEAKAADYDAILFIGGNGMTALFDDPQALSLVTEAQKDNKIIGAICIAPIILAKAGVLEGKIATVSPYGSGDLKKAGATCTGKGIEVDGKIITGKGPAEAEAFGKAVLEALKRE